MPVLSGSDINNAQSKRKLGNKRHNHKIHFSMTQRAIISKIRWFWQVPLCPFPGLWLFFPPLHLGTKTDIINIGVVICRWRERWRCKGRCNSYICRGSHIYICVVLLSPPNDGFFHKRIGSRLYHTCYVCLVKFTICLEQFCKYCVTFLTLVLLHQTTYFLVTCVLPWYDIILFIIFVNLFIEGQTGTYTYTKPYIF